METWSVFNTQVESHKPADDQGKMFLLTGKQHEVSTFMYNG